MFAFLKSLLGMGRYSNGVAKNRLQMVLVQDRSGLSSEEMESFRGDLMGVISKYFVVENQGVGIEWKRTESSTALIINTPVTGRHAVGFARKSVVHQQ